MKRVDVLKYTTGSRMFGLDTETSDFDYIVVYVDPAEAINPAAKTTTKTEFTDENTEVVEVELATFIRGLAGADLKYIEAIHTKADYTHPNLDVGFLREFVLGLDLKAMYAKEITRRYNKTWFKELNSQGKNFNKDQGYDSKFAAHLYRVLVSAANYIDYGTVTTNFRSIRTDYLEVKNGVKFKDDVFKFTTKARENLMPLLVSEEKQETLFPIEFYFRTVHAIYT